MKLSFRTLIPVLAAVLLAACSGKTPNTYRPAPVIGAPQSEQATDATFEMPQQAESTPAPAPAPAAVTAAGMNPAHGQPGHRCDIPVGSPLSSAPKAPATNEITSVLSTGADAPNVVDQNIQGLEKPQAAPAQQGGGKKLNPAHGQPGHDCAVPVGDPLP